MSDESKSFYDVIKQTADDFGDKLLAEHSELKAVSVVFEWNLPENIQGELPTGILRTPDKKISLSRAFDALQTTSKYGKQLINLIEYVADTQQKFIQTKQQAATTQAATPPLVIPVVNPPQAPPQPAPVLTP